jgi:hypothetical protein
MMATRRLHLDRAVAAGLAALFCVGAGALSAWISTSVKSAAAAVELGFAVVLLLALATLARRRAAVGVVGPAVPIVAYALSLVFLLGLLNGGAGIAGSEREVSLLLAASVAAIAVGASVASALTVTPPAPLAFAEGRDGLRHPLFVAALAVVFALACLNLATGSAPLLSPNIDVARLSGTGGVAHQLWSWIIGGLEAGTAFAAVRAIAARKLDVRGRLVLLVGAGLLILLAGRSFLTIIGLSIVIVLAALRRMPIRRLVLLSCVGLVLLGAAGKFRALHSGVQSTSVYGQVKQSAAIGPSVLSSVLQRTPAVTPFQHGAFLFRDFRAALPLHPLGRPEAADIWVTDVIRHRDPSVTGGSPPTLVGGFYIDFGIPGVLVGSALLGALLVVLYGWARRARTVGAIVLYGYIAAYCALSAYSYISLKPQVVVVVLMSVWLHRVEAHGQAARLRGSFGDSPTAETRAVSANA